MPARDHAAQGATVLGDTHLRTVRQGRGPESCQLLQPVLLRAVHRGADRISRLLQVEFHQLDSFGFIIHN